jgi:predicted transcriptional regulator
MSEAVLNGESLQTRYVAEVAADLQKNAENHQRVTALIAELQGQLKVLERDREMLLHLQAAISSKNGSSAPRHLEEAGADAGAPEQDATEVGPVNGKAGAEAPGTKASRVAKKAVLSLVGKSTPSKPEAKNGKATDKAGPGTAPTLVELVHDYLGQQTEPKSVAEVAEAVSTPQRPVAGTGARAALEGLVKKSAVVRSRQGSSVYYETVAQAQQADAAISDAPKPTKASTQKTAEEAAEEAVVPGKREKKATDPTPDRTPLSSDQVLAALRELGGAQAVRSVAERLLGESADSSAANRVRTALMRLVAKDSAAKTNLDGTVLFQATS